MSTNRLTHAMLTHRGRVRPGNEDTCAAAPEVGAYIVCDGMGGAAAGEIASRLAADTFLAYVSAEPPANAKGMAQMVKPQARLNAAVEAANEAVYRQSRSSPEFLGMGTTLVALLYAPIPALTMGSNGRSARRTASSHGNSRASDPATLWLAHVGDSRCYRLRRGRLEQLTGDHSLVEEQLRAGQITAAQAAVSPMRNLITRAIGSQVTVEAEIQSHHPQPGDLYLLASDGLTHEISDEEIAEVLGEIPALRTKAGLTRACEMLIAAANRNGGHDNITVLLVAVTS